MVQKEKSLTMLYTIMIAHCILSGREHHDILEVLLRVHLCCKVDKVFAKERCKQI